MKQNFIQKKLSVFFILIGVSLFSVKTSAQLIPFDCSTGLGYILTNSNPGGGNITSLYSFNLTTGATTLIKADLLPATPANQRFYNGFGYNTVDNFLYGYRYNTNQIVKVGTNGNIELLNMTGGTPATGSYASGDVSPQGVLYLFGSDRFVSVNLNPAAPNYLVATQKLGYTAAINDFAFSPVDGKIYGVTSDASRRLFRFDPIDNTMTILGSVGGLSSTTEADNSFGTAFMDNLGNLFVGNNVSGRIYRIQTPHLLTTNSTITSTLYSSGLAGRAPGDGARCSSAIILPSAGNDQTCSPASSIAPVSINVAGNDAAGTYPLSNSSVRLISGNQRVTNVSVSQGTFSVNTSTGVVQFQPTAGFTTGSASVTYSITDNQGNLSAPATITVTVCPPPTAANDLISNITPGQPGILPTINSNDTAPAGTTLVVSSINLIAPASIPASISEDSDGDGDIDRITVPGQGIWQVNASGTVTFTPEAGFLTSPAPISYTIKNSTGAVSNAATLTVSYLPLATVSGNIFVDANGLSDETVNGEPYTTQGLYTLLISNTGKIISSQEVSTGGIFTFVNVLHGTYSIQLSNSVGIPGEDAPTQASFPASNWLPTGENIGISAGSDGEANGIIQITVTSNLTNVNFGLNQAPTALPVTDIITTPRPGDIYAFKPLTGSDPQDGEYENFSPTTSATAPKPTIQILGSTFQFDSPGEATTLAVLNYGSTVLSITSDNAVISEFDFTELSATLNGTGYTGFHFDYVVIDAAGVASLPVTYQAEWSPALPVKVISFTAKSEGQSVQLTWVTTEELSADRFEIERSADGKAWSKIGEQKAAGESIVRKSYNFVDATVMKGTNYYRLKMIDLDHSFAYSSIVNAVSDGGHKLTFSPNPSRDFIKINGLTGGERIEIINTAGTKISAETSNGASFKYDISKLHTGIYIIVVTDKDGNVTTHRIAKD